MLTGRSMRPNTIHTPLMCGHEAVRLQRSGGEAARVTSPPIVNAMVQERLSVAEPILTEQTRHLLRRGKRPRHQGRDRVDVDRIQLPALGDEVPVLVDQQRALGAR